MRRLLLLMLLVTLDSAHAHMRDRPDLGDWFSGLSNKSGDLCCSFVDGAAIPDADWTVQGEGQQCQILPRAEDQNAPGHYCVRLEGVWWLVPDKAVIESANRYGPAVVWPIYVSTIGAPNKLIGIRCFIKGTET